ncbi:hypothetical protein ACLQ2N_32975 [Streptomyces sp. DT224]|uniref:hypothetical protein n=1 Tax=Streptomyces sp. DT224 TaxID=3393426 RepID=UPI003CEEE02B
MTTAVALDYRTPLLAFRAAVHLVRLSPGPGTLAELSRAALALPATPSGPLMDDGNYVTLLRALERAEESQVFPVIDHMATAVEDLARSKPSWTLPHESEAMANVIRLLAVCHERQPDMEGAPLSPWTRAAETGTRLLGIMLRRTDKRPAESLMSRTGWEFADRLRSAIVHTAVLTAGHFADLWARRCGLFPIGPRVARIDCGYYVEWTRVIGQRRYAFELVQDGWRDGFPYGVVTVRRAGTESVHVFALTDRTDRKVVDRFTASL